MMRMYPCVCLFVCEYCTTERRDGDSQNQRRDGDSKTQRRDGDSKTQSDATATRKTEGATRPQLAKHRATRRRLYLRVTLAHNVEKERVHVVVEVFVIEEHFSYVT